MYTHESNLYERRAPTCFCGDGADDPTSSKSNSYITSTEVVLLIALDTAAIVPTYTINEKSTAGPHMAYTLHRRVSP